MENPYFALHREFRRAGAEVLLSSGQACVVYGVATFSKDGDWIVREDEASCAAIRRVLAAHRADYRLGVPLEPRWLRLGLTSHFEFRAPDGLRIRTDFCSRPPRVPDLARLWSEAAHAGELEVVDVDSLIRLKQTRRARDYAIIGALAESAGLGQGAADIALAHLQDYEHLSAAVARWPQLARKHHREAVRLLVAQAPRAQVVAALALEQDEQMQADQARIAAWEERLATYLARFGGLRPEWRRAGRDLAGQHHDLVALATELLGAEG